MTTIRPARADELDALLAVVREATRRLESQGIHQWDNIYPDSPTLQADIENRHMHVIEAQGAIAGMISLNDVQSPEYRDVTWLFPGRALVVHRLVIAPSHQRQGHATRLLMFAEQEAKKQGYDAIRFDAFTENSAATALYGHLGYRTAGTVKFRKGLFFCFEKPMKTIEAQGTAEPAGRAHVSPAAGDPSAFP